MEGALHGWRETLSVLEQPLSAISYCSVLLYCSTTVLQQKRYGAARLYQAAMSKELRGKRKPIVCAQCAPQRSIRSITASCPLWLLSVRAEANVKLISWR